MISKEYTILIIALFGTALVVWFLLLPQYRSVVEMRGELSDIGKRIGIKQELFAALDNALKFVRENRQKMDIATRYIIPEEPKKEEIMVLFDYLARRSQVFINNFTMSSSEMGSAAPSPRSAPGSVRPSSGQGVESKYQPKTVQISVKVKGAYNNFKGFLRAVEKSLRLFDVQQISFGETNQDGLTEYSLVIFAYYRD